MNKVNEVTLFTKISILSLKFEVVIQKKWKKKVFRHTHDQLFPQTVLMYFPQMKFISITRSTNKNKHYIHLHKDEL